MAAFSVSASVTEPAGPAVAVGDVGFASAVSANCTDRAAGDTGELGIVGASWFIGALAAFGEARTVGLVGMGTLSGLGDVTRLSKAA